MVINTKSLTQVRMLTMWLWIAVIFLIIWLNVLTQSRANLNQYGGYCSILNFTSLSTIRYIFYSVIYLGALLAALSSALGVLIQRARGVGDGGITSLAPPLFVFFLTWSPLLVAITYKHLDHELGMVGELVTAVTPEIQVAFDPILVLCCNKELGNILWRLCMCIPCRVMCQKG